MHPRPTPMRLIGAARQANCHQQLARLEWDAEHGDEEHNPEWYLANVLPGLAGGVAHVDRQRDWHVNIGGLEGEGRKAGTTPSALGGAEASLFESAECPIEICGQPGGLLPPQDRRKSALRPTGHRS